MYNVKHISTLALGLLALGACRHEPAQGFDFDTDTATDSASGGMDASDTDTDSDTEGEPDDPNPASPAVRELIEAACELSLGCCSRGEVDYYLGPWVDEDTCADRLFDLATVSGSAVIDFAALAGLTDATLLVPNLAALDQAVAEGRIEIDEEAIGDCRLHISAGDCNKAEPPAEGCQPLPPPPEPSPCDLENMFVGQIQEGEVCTSVGGMSLDCAPGLTCGVGLGLGISGRCVAIKQAGEICTIDEECDAGLTCSALDGTCQAPRREGEVCVFADREDPSPAPETLLLGCTPDLSCDPITSTCVARCQLGAACIVNDDCDDAQGLACVLGRCGMPRSAGLPCGTDDDCEDGLHCGFDIFDPTALVCSFPKQNGSDCFDHRECESTFCRPDTFHCAPANAVGSPCPSGDSAECDGGACVPEEPLTSCTGPSDCPITGICDVFSGLCGTYCVDAKPDGATCLADSECSSDNCIAGFCRSLPLDTGLECEVAEQCFTQFCSYDSPRVCDTLPLSLGDPCFFNEECSSGVCWAAGGVGAPTCVAGAGAGEPCGGFDQEPCSPLGFYCDTEVEPTVCTPFKETGEDCESGVECRGECLLRHGRLLCTPAVPEGTAVCDGLD